MYPGFKPKRPTSNEPRIFDHHLARAGVAEDSGDGLQNRSRR